MNFEQSNQIQIWREAMSQLRYLNAEVWKRFQFFVWLEVILLVITGGCLARRPLTGALLFAGLGMFCGFVARYILKRNRIYYLQMLAKKSLIEDEIGLYTNKIAGTETDHAFPWRIGPEVVQKIKTDAETWVGSNIRSTGTIARPLFWILEIFILLNGVALMVTVGLWLRH